MVSLCRVPIHSAFAAEWVGYRAKRDRTRPPPPAFILKHNGYGK